MEPNTMIKKHPFTIRKVLLCFFSVLFCFSASPVSAGSGSGGNTPPDPIYINNVPPPGTCCVPGHETLHDWTREWITDGFNTFQRWMVEVFFEDYILPAHQRMTEQLSMAIVDQTYRIGQFLDAKHQMETQQILAQMQAEAQQEFQISEAVCAHGSMNRARLAAQMGSDSSVTLTDAIYDPMGPGDTRGMTVASAEATGINAARDRNLLTTENFGGELWARQADDPRFLGGGQFRSKTYDALYPFTDPASPEKKKETNDIMDALPSHWGGVSASLLMDDGELTKDGIGYVTSAVAETLRTQPVERAVAQYIHGMVGGPENGLEPTRASFEGVGYSDNFIADQLGTGASKNALERGVHGTASGVLRPDMAAAAAGESPANIDRMHTLALQEANAKKYDLYLLKVNQAWVSVIRATQAVNELIDDLNNEINQKKDEDATSLAQENVAPPVDPAPQPVTLAQQGSNTPF